MAAIMAAIAIDFLLKEAQGRSAAVAYVHCNYKSQSNQSPINLLGSILTQLLWFRSTVFRELETSAGDVDVRRFVRSQTQRFPSCIRKDPELQELVTEKIAESVGGIPLKTAELSQALSVEIGARELDMDDIVPAEDIVSVCVGLVTIDKESDIIRLVHHTTQEYFQRAKPILIGLVQEHHFASVCLTYLNFDCFADQVSTSYQEVSDSMERYPLLCYSARYWGVHARSTQDPVSDIALRLLLNGPLVAFNVTSQQGTDALDITDSHKRTPLSFASQAGHEAVVRLLLDHKVNVDAEDFRSRGALSYASECGHEAVVQVLLDHEANIDAKHNYLGRGALSYAAIGGHRAVVRLLLNYNAKGNARDASGCTPLWKTAEAGSTAMSEELLNHEGVDIDAADTWTGNTPLLLAARRGYKEMVELLLRKSALDPVISDMEGRTALWYAAEKDHSEVAPILLDIQAVPEDVKDLYGQTPLAIAASRGNIATVVVLFENNSRDQDNWTPLLSAAYKGHASVLKALIRRGAPDINAVSKGGLMALFCAQCGLRKDCVTIPKKYPNVQARRDSEFGLPPTSRYLFLGNYLLDGERSINTISLLLALKILYPDYIFLLRGRSETRTDPGSFYDDCMQAKLCTGAWELFNKCFDCLPIAAIIGKRILAVPSGLNPKLCHLELIRRLWRPRKIPRSRAYYLICDDTMGLEFYESGEEESGEEESDEEQSEKEEGRNSLFSGLDIVTHVVAQYNLDLICVSSKNALREGYKFCAERKLVKLFTLPNYLDVHNNSGTVMEGGRITALFFSIRFVTIVRG
ncbi:ankyrin repeat-containing domain protein [Podospora australis]|uniref:Ankyrin repeat-containing domain protein n=1 Tax=Podospora australis TaxID=1536484 RepID=A0AAN7AEG9_9PEZI|nr:ankyrin repeat-containing domain protein [Podospora australis]